jgi:hypothetical protein
MSLNSINIITTLRFLHSITNTMVDEIKSKQKNINKFSLDEIKLVRNNYCHIKWMKSILSELNDKVDNATRLYNDKIKPVIDNVHQITDDNDSLELYDMWKLNYINTNEPSEELLKDWAGLDEHNDICRHLKSISKVGYPDSNNIRPLKELKTDSIRNLESKFNITRDDDRTEVYNYDYNGARIFLPVVDRLEDVPSCFYYFKGKGKQSKGVYMSPYPGVVVKVPDSKIIPYSTENSNQRTVKCIKGKECQNTYCTYAHPGMEYIQTSSVSRCPNCPRFGNTDTIVDDLNEVKMEDIRLVSFYSLSGLWASSIWYDKYIEWDSLRIIDDLEMCDDFTLNDFLKSDLLNSDKFK